MCLGKKVYRTEAFAEGLAKRVNLRAYSCPYCQNWHLTKQKVTH